MSTIARSVMIYVFKLKMQLLFRPRKSRRYFLFILSIIIMLTIISTSSSSILENNYRRISLFNKVQLSDRKKISTKTTLAPPKVNLTDPNVACKLLMKEIFGEISNVNSYSSSGKKGANLTHRPLHVCAKKLLDLEWQEDVEMAEKFRNCLNRKVSLPQESLVLTRKNTGLRAKIPVIKYSKNTTKVGTRLYYGLPLDSPFKKKNYPSCSLVGNGGIISNSSCGEDIDDSHFIFRFNAPILQPKDTGTKSSLTTFSPVGVINYRYNSFKDDKDKTRFLKDVTQYKGYIFFDVFTNKLSMEIGEPGVLLLHEASKYIGLHSVSPVVGNPKHFIEVQKFWEMWAGLTNKQETISTGFYFTTAAMALCRDVRLFGFWPFRFDQNGISLPFHYTNDVKWPRNDHDDPNKLIHNFEKEFCALSKLHIAGIIHLQLDKCV